jgi:hypothetical protein
MEMVEIKNELRDLALAAVDTDEGAHALGLVESFKAAHPDAVNDIGPELFDDWLRRRANDVLKPFRSSTRQMKLPGLADLTVPDTVTVSDGEGGYRVKNLDRATANDCAEDERIMAENRKAAVVAHNDAKRRNQLVLPIMAEHGFTTAGEAIRFLAKATA